jgi:hypothetical protein
MLWRDLSSFVLKLPRRISQHRSELLAIGFFQKVL